MIKINVISDNDYCKNVLNEAEREVLDDLETFDVEDESVGNKDNFNNNVEEDYEERNITKIQTGQWLLVKFATKKL